MGRVVDTLVRDLRECLNEIGKNGGMLGPSVYDSAMVARLAPPRSGPGPAHAWLLSQQRSDGGWGSPRYPSGRDLPTLAAVLALREGRSDPQAHDACAAGLAFLRRQDSLRTTIPEDLPIALELTLPTLVAEAMRLGVDLFDEPYRLLASVGEQKRRFIMRGPVVRGTPAAYAWEGLGLPASINVVDAIGSVGTSPSATAAWLVAARDLPELSEARASATVYLERAAASTGCDVPGVVPHSFPVERFEQIWALFAVLSAGLLLRTEIAGPLNEVLDDLAASMRLDGIGYTDVFTVDGDDTSCCVAVLKAAGRNIDVGLVRRFENEEHFFTYPGERNPSLSANAIALYALSFFGEDSASARRFLVSRQSADGRFLDDKWHSSWFYTTQRAVLALRAREDADALQKVRNVLFAHQRADGGFGAAPESTIFETAHALLSLRALREKGLDSTENDRHIVHAYRFLLSRYRPFGAGEEPLWIGKELYAAPRIDRAFELSAMLTTALDLGE